ncbi:VTT domain-containing protein [Microbacterium sp.]|uniref:DedA family protein n=1 Tax=Microbacterium sp. TaxID=51671 RepID=UPI00262B4BAE|nr:VTT domain-containing protein [Microbacterium sp.]
MLTELLDGAATGPWGLIVMSLLVLGDAFLVVVPGEIAVTTMGAVSMASGTPPLWAVIGCAAVAAAAGDLLCYGLGRWVGTERWQWMRAERLQRAQRWARDRLDSRTALVLFTARFIPFARLAINLVAGATRIPLGRYAGLVLVAASAWAAYQAAVGAIVAAFIPGAPIVAVVIAVVVAIVLGAVIDFFINRRRRSRESSPRTVSSD